MKEDQIIPQKLIENRIFNFRSEYVMIDRDLAEMFKVETKVLNQAVKRNLLRFPENFRFQINRNEKNELVTNCDRFKNLKHSRYLPYAFTEQGVAMLSAVLRSRVAINVSIQIMQAFVQMRKTLLQYQGIIRKVEGLEKKQLETDSKFEKLFKALEMNQNLPDKGVFFNGQEFNTYELISKIIRSSNKNIIIIDNYVDDSVLTLLTKKKANIVCVVFTKNITKQLMLDAEKFNQQYGLLEIKPFHLSHDRFIIIDEKEVYHIGASLKDLGKKWFAFSKMDRKSVKSILTEITKRV